MQQSLEISVKSNVSGLLKKFGSPDLKNIVFL